MLLFVVVFLMIWANANAEHHDHLTGVKLPLVHRDKLMSTSSSHNDEYRRASRVLSGAVTDFGMAVVRSGEYYVTTLGVGSPPIEQTLAIDTGSNLTWIQSQGCSEPDHHCFSQSHQRYDPANSASHQWVNCDYETCKYLLEEIHKNGCSYHDNQCLYKYEYADKLQTIGSLALETLTINGTTIPSVIVGCANDNINISFYGDADGMLGLSMGPLSFTSQGNGKTGGAFKLCLGQNGWLKFGRGRGGGGDLPKWATLIPNNKHPSFYYVELLRIEVEVEGKPIVNITEKTFQIDPNTEEGGVIIGTATSVTYLPEAAYNALRDTFNEYMLDKFSITPFPYSLDPILHTCYGLDSQKGSVQLPRVSFIFRGMYMDLQIDPIIKVNATNVFCTVNAAAAGSNIRCLAFAPTTMGYNILAGPQLEDIQITIDTLAGNIGFGPGGC